MTAINLPTISDGQDAPGVAASAPLWSDLLRAVREALSARDTGAAASRLLDAARALDKAATKGVVHRRQASRRIARLTHAVGQLKTGS